MGFSENVLKIALVLALAVIVMYALNCLVNEKMRKPLQEGFQDEFCEAAFTAPGTRVCLWSASAMRYLDVNMSKVTNNLKLSSLSNSCSQWALDPVIVKDAVGVYPAKTTPSSCAVTMRLTKAIEGAMTEKQKRKLASESGLKRTFATVDDELKNIESISFYLSADPRGENGTVSASPVGGSSNTVWYALRLHQNGGSGPNKKVMAKLYKDTLTFLMKNGQKTNGKFYLIMTSPKAMISTDSPMPDSQYLTVADDFNSVTAGDIYLADYPSVASVWMIKYKNKGTPTKVKPFKPVVGIGAYPNDNPDQRGQLGPYKSAYGAFMPSFRRIWNRTWWSPGANGAGSAGKELYQIQVELDQIPDNRQTTYATGDVTVSLVSSKNLDYDNPERNAPLGSPIDATYFPDNQKKNTFKVRSYGDDMLMGSIPTFKSSRGEMDTKIILQLLPKGAKEMGTPNVPLLKGWLISTIHRKGKKSQMASVLPLCAVGCSGVVQNLMGVCQALTGDMKFDQFMLENGLTSLDYTKNFNMSDRLAEASSFRPPSKDWVRYLTPGRLREWSYGSAGSTPLGGANLQRTATVKGVGSINECADYASGARRLPSRSSNVTYHSNPGTGAPLTSQDVAETTNRFLYHIPDGYKVDGAGNNTGSSTNGVCELGMYGDWELLPKDKMSSAVGVVRRGPRNELYGQTERQFREIGGMGTELTGGVALNVETKEQFDNMIGGEHRRENFVVGNLNICAEMCKGDKACLKFDYDETTGECNLMTSGKPTVTATTKKKEVISYEYAGPRNQLAKYKDEFVELPTYTSFMGDPKTIIDQSGRVTDSGIPNVSTIDDCAKMCLDAADHNCDRFSWDAANQVCFLQQQGQEKYDPNPDPSNPRLLYGALKNNFKPYLNPKYYGDNGFVNPMSSGMNYDGTQVPNANVESHIATVNDCAQACQANPWCGVATYDAGQKVCTQNLASATLTGSYNTGDPKQVILKKNIPSDAKLNSTANTSVFNQPRPSSSIDGGISLNRNIKVSSADQCADHCRADRRCDAFVYERSGDPSNSRCNTYQSGDCQNNPNSPTCGQLESPADSPNLYAAKMKLSEERGGEFKIAVGNNGTCRGQLYCQKNWNNEMDGWDNAECVDAIATYENGESINISCWDLPPFSYKGSKLKHFRVKCAKTSGQFAFKEPEGSPMYQSDCNVDTNARILLGKGTGTIDDGTCDCNSYTLKAAFGQKELESKQANWKGAHAAYARTYTEGQNPIDFNQNRVPTNRATSISGNGPALACYVTEDNNNPFISASAKGGNQCAGNTTDYQCVIL